MAYMVGVRVMPAAITLAALMLYVLTAKSIYTDENKVGYSIFKFSLPNLQPLVEINEAEPPFMRFGLLTLQIKQLRLMFGGRASKHYKLTS